jgi:hypothetical protein
MRAVRVSMAALLLASLFTPVSAQDADDALDLAAMSSGAPVFAPRPRSETRGARIGWEINDIRGALGRAAADGLPVVVVADPPSGGVFADALRCPTFNTLAGQAHFILIPLPIADENSDAARLVNALHMDTAFKPTIAVLATRDRQIHEILRVSGYQSESDLLNRFEAVGLLPARPNPLPLASVALGARMPRDCESSAR